MASRRPKTTASDNNNTVLAFALVGLFAVGSVILLVGVPLVVSACTVVHDYYWPPPITSFHYLVTVHEDGASGDITAAGTGSVGTAKWVPLLGSSEVLHSCPGDGNCGSK